MWYNFPLCAPLSPWLLPASSRCLDLLTASVPPIRESTKLCVRCLSLRCSLETPQSQQAGAFTGLNSFLSLRDDSSLLPDFKLALKSLFHISTTVFFLLAQVRGWIWSLLFHPGWKQKFLLATFKKSLLLLLMPIWNQYILHILHLVNTRIEQKYGRVTY